MHAPSVKLVITGTDFVEIRITYAIYIFTIQLHSVQITREASKCTHGKCTPENHFNSLVLVFCGNAAAKNTGVKEKKPKLQTNKQTSKNMGIIL